jgi:hypothetical protein
LGFFSSLIVFSCILLTMSQGSSVANREYAMSMLRVHRQRIINFVKRAPGVEALGSASFSTGFRSFWVSIVSIVWDLCCLRACLQDVYQKWAVATGHNWDEDSEISEAVAIGHNVAVHYATSAWNDIVPVLTIDIAEMLNEMPAGETLLGKVILAVPPPVGPALGTHPVPPPVSIPLDVSLPVPSSSVSEASDRPLPSPLLGYSPPFSLSVLTPDRSPVVPDGTSISISSDAIEDKPPPAIPGRELRSRTGSRRPAVPSVSPILLSEAAPRLLKLTPEQELERQAIIERGGAIHPSGLVAMSFALLCSWFLTFGATSSARGVSTNTRLVSTQLSWWGMASFWVFALVVLVQGSNASVHL